MSNLSFSFKLTVEQDEIHSGYIESELTFDPAHIIDQIRYYMQMFINKYMNYIKHPYVNSNEFEIFDIVFDTSDPYIPVNESDYYLFVKFHKTNYDSDYFIYNTIRFKVYGL